MSSATSETDASAPFSESYWPNPGAWYSAALRGGCPVRQAAVKGLGRVWVIGGFDNARAALLDERISHDADQVNPAIDAMRRRLGLSSISGNPLYDETFLNADGPEHQVKRNLVRALFSRRRTERLLPRIESLAAGLVDAIATAAGPSGGQVVDLVAGLAIPLPVTVICELLGIPQAQHAEFRETVAALMVVDHDASMTAAARIREFVAGLLEAKRASPGEDLTSTLLGQRNPDDPARPALTDDDLASLLILLFVAGHETTVNLIGCTLVEMATRPGLWREIAGDPGLIPGLIEEVLRYRSPVVHGTPRVTVSDVEYGGETIPAGSIVLPSLASANRDPDRFPDPDVFDPRRATGGHLSFGYGPHYCMGTDLGRAEAVAAIRAAVRRFVDVVPVDQVVEYQRSMIMHGPTGLRVRVVRR